jgi:site-specific recombinase XerD
MLHRHINQFLDYCRMADFSIRSIQALSARLNEFEIFLKTQRIRSIKRVRYRHLIDFAADAFAPSLVFVSIALACSIFQSLSTHLR